MLRTTKYLLRMPPLTRDFHPILLSSAYSSSSNKHKTHYDTLCVETTASKREIRAAFLTLSKKYHPDISKRGDAHKHFMEINEAYEILYNPTSRYRYDLQLHTAQSGNAYTHPPNMSSDFYYQNVSEREWARAYQNSMPRRNHGPLIMFLLGLMVVATVGHTVRINASHKQYQKAADEESRRNNLIYNSVREKAAKSTVSEQLERLSQKVRQQQNK